MIAKLCQEATHADHAAPPNRLLPVLVRSRDAAARRNPRCQAAVELAGDVGAELRRLFKQQRLKMRDAFDDFDIDGDGVVTPGEFRAGLASLRLGLTDDQVDDILRIVDKDGDGQINYSEFAVQFGGGASAQELAKGIAGQWGRAPGKFVDCPAAGAALATEAAFVAGRLLCAPSAWWPLGLTVLPSPPAAPE